MAASRVGRHGEPFTVDDLATALRVVPRDAVFYVQLPDGTLAPVVRLRPAKVRADDGTALPGSATDGGRSAIVLEVGRQRGAAE